MSKFRRTSATPSETLDGRKYRSAKVDFLTRSPVQRAEDRLRGGRGGKAEGEGFGFQTATGEQPAHSVIDAQRDRALVEAAEAFEKPRTNAIQTRDEASAAQQAAERERDRLIELRAAKQAELRDMKARHAA